MSITTTDDAHRLMLGDLIRERDQAIRTAKREIASHITRLQRAAESLDKGAVPYLTDRNVDDRQMAEALAKAATLDSAIETIRGYLAMVDAPSEQPAMTLRSIQEALDAHQPGERQGTDHWLRPDSQAAKIVHAAVKAGYLKRESTTQVHWTNEGLAKARLV